jgi:putative transcriptional regulator
MLEVERDHRPIDIKIDVKKLRTELGMSQPQFAEAFGFGLRTVRNWEQGHRYPMSTARVLLYLVSCAPRQAMRHLAEMRK